MLRKGLVALMMGVICAGSAVAEQPVQKGSNPAPTGLIGWFKNKTSGSKTTSSKSTSSKTSASKANVAKSSTGKPTITRPTQNKAAAASSTKSQTTMASSAKSKPTSQVAGVERAVVNDAERQSVQVRQTAANPSDSAPSDVLSGTASPALQPVPIQQAPVLPNLDTISGPQYFSVTSGEMSNPAPVHPSNNWQTYQAPQLIQVVSQGQYWNTSSPYAPVGPVYSGAAPMEVHSGMPFPQGGNMYPQTGAALYPAPRPGIPQQVGGIAIENQAFHPHEMLYPHQYKAMYGPYYYKVNGGWMLTPFGVWSRENWKLQGTTVDVKYKSHISPLTFFKPPVIR